MRKVTKLDLTPFCSPDIMKKLILLLIIFIICGMLALRAEIPDYVVTPSKNLIDGVGVNVFLNKIAGKDDRAGITVVLRSKDESEIVHPKKLYLEFWMHQKYLASLSLMPSPIKESIEDKILHVKNDEIEIFYLEVNIDLIKESWCSIMSNNYNITIKLKDWPISDKPADRSRL
jgi:hypothetical protein